MTLYIISAALLWPVSLVFTYWYAINRGFDIGRKTGQLEFAMEMAHELIKENTEFPTPPTLGGNA